jgi:hypothetical protein
MANETNASPEKSVALLALMQARLTQCRGQRCVKVELAERSLPDGIVHSLLFEIGSTFASFVAPGRAIGNRISPVSTESIQQRFSVSILDTYIYICIYIYIYIYI